MNKIAQHYSHMRIQTAGLQKLICMIHEKSLFYIRKGLSEGKKSDLERAQNLIYQLELAIDRKDDCSSLLAQLYAHCYHLLDTCRKADIDQARILMEELRGAFEQLFREGRKLNNSAT
ncbi:MAG: flagellar protein FliS [Chitinispirillaceae bacterium]